MNFKSTGRVRSQADSCPWLARSANVMLIEPPVASPFEYLDRSMYYAIGSLVAYVTAPGRRDFQPVNANYGLFPDLAERVRRGAEKKRAHAERALGDLEPFRAETVGPGRSAA